MIEPVLPSPPKMPNSPRLQRFVEDELSRSTVMAERTVQGTLAQLQQPRPGMLGASERQHYHDLLQRLPLYAARFAQAFDEALKRFVRAEVQEQDPQDAGSAPHDSRSGLSLMDETRVEADIEISRAAQLIDGAAEWELRELQTFTSALAGQKHVSAESNPFRPLVYARALWQAVGAVATVPVQRAILMQTAAGVLSGQLKLAWAAACTRLEEKGIEPSIYRTVVMPSHGAARAPTFDVTRPGALEELLPSMPVRKPTDAAAATGPARSTAALEQALAQLEAQLARAMPAGPSGTPATSPLRQYRDQLSATTAKTVDQQVIELLSRLFEAVLTDPQLPPAFRAPIVRLQVSALRVALVDPSMLHAHDHPVWQLMNRIAASGESAGPAASANAQALLAFCETLVGDIARAPVQDAEVYRRGLVRLQSFLAEQLRLAQAEAASTIAALAHAERLESLARDLAARLTEQVASIRTSATIRRFVTGPWARALAEAMLRFGDKKEPTLGYLKATDELLWSLRLPDHPQSRQRLVALLPGLLQRLREGMALGGMPNDQQDALLDELMAVHTEALRPGKHGGDESTPQEIVQRLRDEVVADTASPTPFRDSLIDLSSMETVPADAMSTGGGTPTADPAQRIDTLAPGNRCRLFVQGHWTPALLLWRSAHGGYFVFADNDVGSRVSITRRALERLSEEGLLHTFDEHSLLQRSVDRLVRKLAAPA